MQIPTNAKAVIADAVEAKLATLDTAKAAFNTAMELYAAGNDKSLEADEYADNGARALFQMQTGGLITKEETSATLGQVFGFKVSKTGKASKTPEGQGEVIRKRVVRAVQTFDYLNGGDCPTFLEGADVDEVSRVFSEFCEGYNSIFTTYDKLGKLKERETVPTALNPKSMEKVLAEMAKDGFATAIAANAELLPIYQAMAKLLPGLVAPEQVTNAA